MERELDVSYPTVRAKLDQLWIRLGYREDPNAERPISAESIVRSLQEGDLDVDRAVDELRKRRSPGP